MANKSGQSSGWNLIRGGQTTLHAIRMTVQVFKQFSKLIALCVVLIYVGIAYYVTTPDERYYGGKWLFAYVEYAKLDNKELLINIEYEGVERKVKAYQIVHSKRIATKWVELKNKLYLALLYTVIFGGGFFFFMCWYIYMKGKEQGEDEHLRGSTLVDTLELIKVVRKKKLAGKIKVAGVPIPSDTETANMAMAGGMKSGKSQAIMETMRCVKRLKQRAIVYDNTGDFVEKFYNPETDIILNPFDSRMPRWDVWCEVKAEWDYTNICEVLIPDDAAGNDPFWRDGARIVLEEIMKKVGKNSRSNQELLEKINRVTTEEIVAYIKDTDARVLLSEGAEKATASLRSMMVTYTRILKYLPTEGEYFSLKEWVLNEKQKGWVFITTKEEQKSALRPLLTCWMNVATSQILSLKPNRLRRIWYYLDELPTLNRIPTLLNTMTNARKFGGCGVVGFQNYPQIKKLYKKDEADAIIEACTNMLILRANGKESAEWASKELKEREIMQANESLSFGAHEMRDGVSINKQRRVERLVLATELQDLDDLHGYLRFGGNYPIGKVKLKYYPMKEIAKSFLMRPGVGEVELAEICDQKFERDLEKAVSQISNRPKKERQNKAHAQEERQRVEPTLGIGDPISTSDAPPESPQSYSDSEYMDNGSAMDEYEQMMQGAGESSEAPVEDVTDKKDDDDSDSVYDYRAPL